jgi:hypothetical protein
MLSKFLYWHLLVETGQLQRFVFPKTELWQMLDAQPLREAGIEAIPSIPGEQVACDSSIAYRHETLASAVNSQFVWDVARAKSFVISACSTYNYFLRYLSFPH